MCICSQYLWSYLLPFFSLFLLDVIMADERSTGPWEPWEGSIIKLLEKEADPDGYFLFQLAEKVDDSDMFLTAENASSLSIARKLCLLLFSRLIMSLATTRVNS